MNKLLAAFFGLILCATPVLAQDYAVQPGKIYTTFWNLPSWETNIAIQKDSSLIITETITADFSLDHSEHHGIYRYIPVKYKDRYGNYLSLHKKLLSVTDENGTPVPYQETNSGANWRLKIGDPDLTWKEPKTYVIKYQIDRAINYFDHDELYWNVTGNDGQVDILNAKLTITLPEESESNRFLTACYTGPERSTQQECESKVIDNHTVEFKTTDLISPSEGFTGIFGFPKGIVEEPTMLKKVGWFLLDNLGYLIPFIVLAGFIFSWYKYGRDPRATRNTIIPEYDLPKGLLVTEAGTLIDEQVDMRDIVSCIIDLAVKGYLTITEEQEKGLIFSKTDHVLKKTDKHIDNLKEYEKLIYNSIFADGESVKLSSLKNEFYIYLPKIQKAIYEELSTAGYFSGNPDKIRKKYLAAGSFCLTFGFILFSTENFPLAIGIIISGVIIMVGSKFMPRKGQKGADARIKVLGLEEYIRTAEKDRAKFYEQQNIFEKVLPFAIAFGLTEKWCNAFKDVLKESPNWYHSSNPNFSSWNANNFIYSLNNFNNTVSTTLSSAPRSTSASSGFSGFSSGGGFSGGGFGGGGSGGW